MVGDMEMVITSVRLRALTDAVADNNASRREVTAISTAIKMAVMTVEQSDRKNRSEIARKRS